ncbi:MAG: hypothetical protein JWN68_1902 [Nocardioides sp.]|jgi:ABC-type branched-subunit amino acid transport system permease subunit|uniref:branched-chain amino acid ABC transporter permease n=1 Tax=Nocardioides sp. TaxID=35761 RepID=UPI00344C4196|nr:hypothetical protein [Cryobacterium sp.]MCW2833949.1 hypothetical protein [Nocardioides sp.]
MTMTASRPAEAPAAPRRWPRLLLPTAMAGLVLYLVTTGVTAQPYGLSILTSAMIFGLYAAGVDMSWGHGGILMLGSALFFGLGAYGMAYAITNDIEPLVAYPIVLACSVLLGLLIAYVGFRSRAAQIQFGLIGLAVALAFQRLAVSAYDLTGGSNGLTGVTGPSIAGVELTDTRAYYFFVLTVTSVIALGLWWIQRSAWGDAVRAIRDDRDRAESLGYPVNAIRYQVVAISAAVVTTAGALFPSVSGTAYPELFGIAFNMQALVWVAIGGGGTLFGPLLLAFGLTVSQSYLAGVSVDYYLLVIGVLFVVTVVAAPQGIGGLVRDAIRKVARR